jgi:hypothetical protein
MDAHAHDVAAPQVTLNGKVDSNSLETSQLASSLFQASGEEVDDASSYIGGLASSLPRSKP